MAVSCVLKTDLKIVHHRICEKRVKKTRQNDEVWARNLLDFLTFLAKMAIFQGQNAYIWPDWPKLAIFAKIG